MDKDLLQSFCNKHEDFKFNYPFVMDGWACATNGCIIIRVPLDTVEGVTREAPIKNTLQWQPDQDGEWVDLPPYELLYDSRSCPVCHGEFSVKICHKCDKEGYLEFDGHGLNAFLLEMIKDLPDVKLFSRRDDNEQYYFKFNGGHGVIRGMRMYSKYV